MVIAEKYVRSNSPMTPGVARQGVVLHALAARLKPQDEIINWFDFIRDPKYRASYDYVIPPEDDGKIFKTCPDGRFAWHAGKSSFAGTSSLNQPYFGICFIIRKIYTYEQLLESMKDPASYTEAAYQKAAWLCRKLMKENPKISLPTITTHDVVSSIDVRPDPKRDPGPGFDIAKLKQLISIKQAGTI